MPGLRLRSAYSQLMAEVTKYVRCAVASAVAGCGEANLISEHRSITIELQLHTTDLQQHYLFCAGHDPDRTQVWRDDNRAARRTAPNHEGTIQKYSSEPWGEPYRSGLGTVSYGLHLINILKSQQAAR